MGRITGAPRGIGEGSAVATGLRCSLIVAAVDRDQALAMQKKSKKPFFARFLESQELAKVDGGATRKYPSDSDEHVTLKYPSDSDEDGSSL